MQCPAQSESTCTWNVCIRQHASPVLHQVSNQPFEFLHVSTPWLFHVSCETHLTMCLTRLTLRHAIRTCFCKVWPSCQLAHVLQVDTCKSTCELHRRSALSTHPAWPSRVDRQHVFHRRVLSSLLTQAFSTPSDGGMGENTSSGPSCSSLSLAFLISRHTNLERHFSPFIFVHPFQHERFATVVVALFHIDNFENSHFHHVLHFLFPSCNQQLRINPRAVDSPFAFKLCGIVTFIRHWTCKMHFSNSECAI